jgi:hypothetical protein
MRPGAFAIAISAALPTGDLDLDQVRAVIRS